MRRVVMIGAVPLLVIALGPMLLLWLLMSRLEVLRWVVAGILFGLGALGSVLIHFRPRGFWEFYPAALALAVATVVVARVIERRRLGPGRQTQVVLATHLFAGWLLTVLLLSAVLWR